MRKGANQNSGMWIILFLIWMVPSFAWANPLELTSQTSNISLLPFGETWFDASKTATFEEAQKAPYQPIEQRGYINYGLNHHFVHWYRIPLRVSEDSQHEWIFRGGAGSMTQKVYLVDSKGQVQEIPGWKIGYFRLLLNPGEEYQLYYRAQDHGWHASWMELYTIDEYWYRATRHETILSLYWGALAIMAAYNFFLFLSIRDRVYLFYVGSIAAYGLFQYVAVDFQMAWHFSDPEVYATVCFMTALLVTLAFVQFAQQMLHTAEVMPKWHRVLQIYKGYCAIGLAIALFIPLTWVNLITAPAGIITPIFMLASGFLALKSQTRVAQYFLYAWGAYVIGILLFTLNVLGMEPLGLTADNIQPLTKAFSVLEIVLLALALGERYNALKNENLALKTQEAASLEVKVAERTEELRKANQAKDRFFSIISHDLRGPIGSLAVTYSQIIIKPEDLSEDLLDATKQSLNRTYQLLEELLSWSQSQSGTIEVKKTDFDLLKPVSGSVELLTHAAKRKHLTLTHEVEPGLVVHADIAMVETIVRNLVNNALKFTPAGGIVRVYAETKGRMVQVTVEDTGVGISPENIKNLFQIDKKVKSSLGTDQESGTGLGLVLCREFVVQNGGQIWVESELGSGSRFIFTLPLAAEREAGKPSVLSLETFRERYHRILLVEDDPIHIRATGFALRPLKVSVINATNGQEALRLLQSQPFDLVLMDIDLPGISGVELTRMIKNQPNAPKILALSSYLAREIKEKFGEVPFDGHLTKPLNVELLLRSLN